MFSDYVAFIVISFHAGNITMENKIFYDKFIFMERLKHMVTASSAGADHIVLAIAFIGQHKN